MHGASRGLKRVSWRKAAALITNIYRYIFIIRISIGNIVAYSAVGTAAVFGLARALERASMALATTDATRRLSSALLRP